MLAFKPKTDNIYLREAPVFSIINSLVELGITINGYDPVAIHKVKVLLGNKINYSLNKYYVLQGADVLIIATELSEFRTPDFERIENEMNNPVIFDGRNLFESGLIPIKIKYYSVGTKKLLK